MNILIFDTATPLEIIVLSTKSGVFTQAGKSSAHAASLFSGIGSLLAKAGIAMADVEAIGVGTGPGSFTGLRIAVSTARMLAQISGIPLAGLMTHDIFAVSLCREAADGSFLLPAFDAKKKRVFGALYRVAEGAPHTIIPPGDYDLRLLLAQCESSAPLITTGDGAKKYQSLIRDLAGSFVHRDSVSLDGEKILDMAVQKLKESPCAYGSIVPFYARKSDAEEAKEQKARTLSPA